MKESMTRLTAIFIASCCCLASYYAGRANPSDYHAAKLTASGYDAGRQSVINELPRQKIVQAITPTPVDVAQQCVAWWTGTNIKAARTRMCGK